jgi:general secretion pathway protein G
MKLSQNKGFTLVELLVVISIIGILSSFAIVSLNSARMKARDALRKGDMAQLRTALNLYYDEDLEYPICGTWDEASGDFGATVDDADLTSGSNCYKNELNAALTSGTRPVMQLLPKEPKNPDNLASFNPTQIYRYVSDGTQYAVVYYLEDGGIQVMRGW